MLINTIFNTKLSQTATVSTEYKTQINSILGKIEDRLSIWGSSKTRFKIPSQIINYKEYTDLIDIFNESKGMLNSFLIQDPLDNKIEKNNSRLINTQSNTFVLQQIKNQSNKIVKNIENLKIFLNNQQITNYSLNQDWSIFSTENLQDASFECNFYKESRFETDTINFTLMTHSKVKVESFNIVQI